MNIETRDKLFPVLATFIAHDVPTSQAQGITGSLIAEELLDKLDPLIPGEEAKQKALADCYMMARRQVARLTRETHPGSDRVSLEAWGHVIRFCESAGEKADFLRDSVPTDMQGG
jgi:hypothetical protein